MEDSEFDLEKELGAINNLLVLVSNEKYNEMCMDAAKKFSKKRLCYVSINKTHESLESALQKVNANLDNVLFIDAISKTIQFNIPSKKHNCYFISSPRALTEISLRITDVLNKKQKIDSVIFDSITNLLTYQKESVVLDFLSFILNKIKSKGIKSVFYVVPVVGHENFINDISMRFDKVVNLS